MPRLPLRFWIELGLGTLSGALLVLTLLWNQWIELAFDVDPDAGSGSLEWGLVALSLVLTLLFGALAALEWRRFERQSARS